MDAVKMLGDTGIECRTGIVMKDLTYYMIGGPADIYICPKNYKELAAALNILKDTSTDHLMFGKGSNMLVSDKGYRGCVIDMSRYYNNIRTEGEIIFADAGCTMQKIQKCAEDNELSGFEELSGIPGTLGGALVMNAGCYGSEIKNIVQSVTVIENKEKKKIPARDIHFGYRESGLKGSIILGAQISLKKDDLNNIIEKRILYSKKRNEKQPVSQPSCGSVFKRPKGKYAGELIEKAGLKGETIGGARVSEKHAGFIINTGNATSEDVRMLISKIKEVVKERFNIDLKEEVIYIGSFNGGEV